jgi:hypothetical protein
MRRARLLKITRFEGVPWVRMRFAARRITAIAPTAIQMRRYFETKV